MNRDVRSPLQSSQGRRAMPDSFMFPPAFLAWIETKLRETNKMEAVAGIDLQAFPIGNADDARVFQALVEGVLYTKVQGRGYDAILQAMIQHGIYIPGGLDGDDLANCGSGPYRRHMDALVWTLIQRFTVAQCVDDKLPIHVRESMGKDVLKKWCHKVVQKHMPELKVANFMSSWQDGRAFLAMLQEMDPNMDLELQKNPPQPSRPKANLERAFMGFQSFGFRCDAGSWLSPDFVMAGAREDGALKKSIITFLASVHNYIKRAHIDLHRGEAVDKEADRYTMDRFGAKRVPITKMMPWPSHTEVSIMDYIQQNLDQDGTFADPDFLPDRRSLYIDPDSDIDMYGEQRQPLEWARLSDICEKPVCFDGGANACDVIQGSLGDCWFISAIAIMSDKPTFIDKLFVTQDDYAEYGCYVVRLFKQGEWKDVVVDDYVPVDEDGYPAYARSTSDNEIWVMLLEKAYAKVHGCYEAIDGGVISYALRDLTAGAPGITKITDLLRDCRDDPTQMVQKVFDSGFGMTMLGICNMSGGTEEDMGNGLHAGHAYSLVGVYPYRGQHLFKIRNPWGTGEWTGDWSDQSERWDHIARRDLQHGTDDDGVFFMNYHDFILNFTHIYYVNVVPDDWHVERLKGCWEGHTAGGCIEDPQSWSQNPQIKMEVPVSGQVRLVVSLQQPDVRMRYVAERDNLEWAAGDGTFKANIGFMIFRSPDGQRVINPDPGNVVAQVPYECRREVQVQLDNVAPGTYYIVPSTFYQGIEIDFVVTLWSNTVLHLAAEAMQMDAGPRQVADVHLKGSWEFAEQFAVEQKEDSELDPEHDTDPAKIAKAFEPHFTEEEVNAADDIMLYELDYMFDMFDSDQSGYLEGVELKRLLKELSFEDPQLVIEAVTAMDTNSDGRVSKQELETWWRNGPGSA